MKKGVITIFLDRLIYILKYYKTGEYGNVTI